MKHIHRFPMITETNNNYFHNILQRLMFLKQKQCFHREYENKYLNFMYMSLRLLRVKKPM
jgi:hypothetical protein